MTIQANFPAIKPALLLDFQNTKQLDSRITYTRASTASYYDGVTTSKAEENLVTYSQEFENGFWSTSSSTKTANTTTAPDGTTTADTITASAGTSVSPRIFPTTLTGISGIVYAVSIYAKAGTNNYLQITDTTVGMFANYDLSTGVLGTSTLCTSSIVSAGNGWYRCMLTYTSGGTDIRPLFVIETGASVARLATWNPAGTETLFLWGAQVEQRSAVTAYTATTTQAITNYIPKLQTAASGVARFDNNPTTGESLGLLIEESRTNLLTYSEQIDNAAWTKSGASITANTIVAPDGTLTGDALVENTSNTVHLGARTVSLTSGQSYTFSIYAKSNGRNFSLYATGVTGNVGRGFNLSTGATQSAGLGYADAPSFSITPVGNSWYRCTITVTASSTGNNDFGFWTLDGSSSASYTGNGFSGVFLWGAQLEAGAFATSYIPTVASQVTRAADAASMTGTNFSTWYNQTQGTFYAHATANGFTTNEMIFSLTDGTLASTIQAYLDTSTQIQTNIWNNGTLYLTNTVGTAFKYALGVETNNCSVTLNAGTVTTDTSVGPPYSYSQFNIGNRNGSLIFNGTIKKLAYYPLRVTNAQLQALTS